MPVKPEERKIVGPGLEVTELGRDPEWFGAYRQVNELLVAIAHLAATDGSVAKLLRCLASGVLRVAVEDPDGHAPEIDGLGRVSVDLKAAGANVIPIDNTLDAIAGAPVYFRKSALNVAEINHGGAGTESHDFGDAVSRALVITSAGIVVRCFGSAIEGGLEVPLGICTGYAPLVSHTNFRYLDVVAAAAGYLHIGAWICEAW